MSKSLIRNCQFKFKCKQQWGSLIPTDDIKVRNCKECDRTVHLCDNDVELIEAMKLDQCVAIPKHYLNNEPVDIDSLFNTGVPIIR